MRPDGDPEPDDYGLPHVHVVVPDDARELDREVLAYRREERRRRRRARTRRLVRPFTRFGVAIPIIAGALLVALVSGALMTAFGPRPAPRPPAAQLAQRPTAPPGRVGGLLPRGDLVFADDHASHPLIDQRPAVIGIVPPGYRCDAVVSGLAGLAETARVRYLLVADPRPAGGHGAVSVKELRACAGNDHSGDPRIVEDRAGVLARAYVPAVASAPPPGGAPSPASSAPPRKPVPSAPPASAPASAPVPTPGSGPLVTAPGRITAVLVRSDGVVDEVVADPKPGRDLGEKVKALELG